MREEVVAGGTAKASVVCSRRYDDYLPGYRPGEGFIRQLGAGDEGAPLDWARRKERRGRYGMADEQRRMLRARGWRGGCLLVLESWSWLVGCTGRRAGGVTNELFVSR